VILKKLKREIFTGLSRLSHINVSTNYNGMTLKFPMICGMGKDHFIPGNKWMERSLRAFLSVRTGTVVDVGVNTGVLLIKTRMIGQDIRYVGFDPNPSCILYCQELIRLNNFRNADVYPIAFSDSAGIQHFYLNAIGDKGGTLFSRFRNTNFKLYSSFKVMKMTGDEFMNQFDIDDPVVIKIDVEGAELETLCGLKNTLREKRPFIFCELLYSVHKNGQNQAESADRIRRIFDLVCGFDYRALGLFRSNRVEPASPDDVFNLRARENYIFVPEEFADAVNDYFEENGAAQYKR